MIALDWLVGMIALIALVTAFWAFVSAMTWLENYRQYLGAIILLGILTGPIAVILGREAIRAFT
jgi:hypothetical protein